MIARLVLPLLLAVVAIDASAADRREILDRIAGDFIVPRYQALADATGEQKKVWDSFCAKPSAAGVDDLQAAFHKVADAWSSIEIVRYGPISKDFRHERLAHWPERRNAVSRALESVLRWNEEAILTPKRFAGSSVAGQGVTAMERLLTDVYKREALAVGGEWSKYCALGRAIAGSQADVSAAVLNEWIGKNGLRESLATADENTLREAVTRIATDLLAAYEFVDDLKLGAIMGPELGKSRAAMAEGRRSGRPTRIIVLNLEAMRALTRISLDTEDDQVIDALDNAIRMARDLPPQFATLADDPKRRWRLVLLRDMIWSARNLSQTTIPPALDITLGFNSLDGD